MNPIKQISYSKYSLFQQCQRKFHYIYIDKFKEPPSEALERGGQIHTELEEYMKLAAMPLPPSLEKLSDYLVPLKGKAISEEFWSADNDFKPTESWDDKVYVGKLDLHLLLGSELLIIDLKTGKVRPKQMDQLEFYAILGLERYPEADTVTMDLVYCDCGTIVSHSFTRAQLPLLKEMWKARLEPFKQAIVFPPNVTALCNWCSFQGSKGGPCDAS